MLFLLFNKLKRELLLNNKLEIQIKIQKPNALLPRAAGNWDQ